MVNILLLKAFSNIFPFEVNLGLICFCFIFVHFKYIHMQNWVYLSIFSISINKFTVRASRPHLPAPIHLLRTSNDKKKRLKYRHFNHLNTLVDDSIANRFSLWLYENGSNGCLCRQRTKVNFAN